MLLFAGDDGETSSAVGAAGGVLSSTNVTELVEQVDVLPATSVAVALNVVDESSATLTVRPGDAKAVSLPVAAGMPLQSLVA